MPPRSPKILKPPKVIAGAQAAQQAKLFKTLSRAQAPSAKVQEKSQKQLKELLQVRPVQSASVSFSAELSVKGDLTKSRIEIYAATPETRDRPTADDAASMPLRVEFVKAGPHLPAGEAAGLAIDLVNRSAVLRVIGAQTDLRAADDLHSALAKAYLIDEKF
jgi:hypothetical protein